MELSSNVTAAALLCHYCQPPTEQTQCVSQMLLGLIVVIMLYSFADITLYDVVSLGVGHELMQHSFASDRIVDLSVSHSMFARVLWSTKSQILLNKARDDSLLYSDIKDPEKYTK